MARFCFKHTTAEDLYKTVAMKIPRISRPIKIGHVSLVYKILGSYVRKFINKVKITSTMETLLSFAHERLYKKMSSSPVDWSTSIHRLYL